jgi:F-type H+-transporting ATPase subunit gamma
MARAQEIATRIGSLKELLEVVGAIRALSAVQMQQAQRSLEAVNRYSNVIAGALAESASLLSSRPAAFGALVRERRALLVFGSEHGFCGAFNARLITETRSALDRNPNKTDLVIVGTRLSQRAAEHGLRPEVTLAMATHSTGVTAAARSVADEVYRLLWTRNVGRLEVIHGSYAVGKQIGIERLTLLPLDPGIFAANRPPMPPVLNLATDALFEELATEYLFAMLERAAMESFAAENAARFRAMDAAHENIENKSRDLIHLAQQVRQESVTTELLDLIAGIEAIAKGRE